MQTGIYNIEDESFLRVRTQNSEKLEIKKQIPETELREKKQ